MKGVLLVGIGGFLGAVARFKVGEWVLRYAGEGKFPLGTFAVNVIGCFTAGILAGLGEKQGLFSANTKLFLFVGVLGGFTTFSAFGLETVGLLRRGEVLLAIANIILSVVVAMLALWIGIRLGFKMEAPF